MEDLKSSRVVYDFQVLCIMKSKIFIFTDQIYRTNIIDRLNKFV